MNVTRHYGSNGQLLRYEVTKEMRVRGKRTFYKEQLKDAAIRFIIVMVVMSILLIAFLVKN